MQEQVNGVNILCALIVNQSAKFITLVGQDYSVIYNQLHDDLEFYANSENIDLTDKDGIDERIVTLKVINGGKS